MAFLITLLIVFLIIIIICVALSSETDGNSLFVALLFLGFGWLMIMFKTTSYDKPIEIPMSKLSIMTDDEIAIIRYGGGMKTYNTIKEYKAIKDSTFQFMETKERNVSGNYNGSTFELIVK